MELLNDEQLIEWYIGGETLALEVLVARYLPVIFGFVLRSIGQTEQAEDLTQDIFLKIWKNINKFDNKKKFKSWIFTIARRTMIDYFRKKKIATTSVVNAADGQIEIFESIAAEEITILEKMEKMELEKELNEQLLKLSLDERMLLLLYYGQKITFAEIGEINNEPLDTVKSRHRRALIKLKKLMINGQ